MLFDLRPKEKREELFDREKELKETLDAFDRYSLILLLGIRRIGKSSLLRVAINESENIGIIIDARKLYLKGSLNESAVLNEIGRIKGYFKKLKLREVDLKFLKFDINSNKHLVDIFENLNRLGEKSGRRIILAFDEAQYLRFYGNRGGRDLLVLFAYTYDNLENITLVFTGSEVGLLHSYLNLKNYEMPLYGRLAKEITVEPFPREVSFEFLRQGFKELGVNAPDPHIELAIDHLDGIPGWLVEFGTIYAETRNFEISLDQTFRRAKNTIYNEIRELEKRSNKYRFVLKAIALGWDRWKNIKEYLHAREIRTSDSRLSEILRNLEKMGWIRMELRDGKKVYKIIDPVVEQILKGD